MFWVSMLASENLAQYMFGTGKRAFSRKKLKKKIRVQSIIVIFL